MIDLPGEFERSWWGHPRYGLAEQRDHLLIGMAVTVVHHDAGFQIVSCPRVEIFEEYGSGDDGGLRHGDILQ